MLVDIAYYIRVCDGQRLWRKPLDKMLATFATIALEEASTYLMGLTPECVPKSRPASCTHFRHLAWTARMERDMACSLNPDDADSGRCCPYSGRSAFGVHKCTLGSA
jgi:hypothetical protein